MGLFFLFGAAGTEACPSGHLAFIPAAVEQSGPVGKPHEEGGQDIMAKSKSSKVKPISIRYTCAPNGDQVGLSHYLMADAKKAK
jgi:modified peptide precursor CbpA